MRTLADFLFRDLPLDGKVILDAAVGAGGNTRRWAERIHVLGSGARIVGVDLVLPKEAQSALFDRLGELSRYVSLRETDIRDLSFLEDDSIDIVTCDQTLIFLETTPLRSLKALSEFRRVLRPDGWLFLTSETPVEFSPETEGQWRRWNLSKAIRALQGETWASEPRLEETKEALRLLGFEIVDEMVIPPERDTRFVPCIDEWREVMSSLIEELSWGARLRDCLREQCDLTYEKIRRDGYLSTPPSFALRCLRQAIEG